MSTIKLVGNDQNIMDNKVQPLAPLAESDPALSSCDDFSLHNDPEMEGEFTLFSRLPLELRDKIWRYASPGKHISNTDLEVWNSIASELETDHLLRLSSGPRIIRVEPFPFWTTIHTQTAHADGNSTITETREHFQLRFTSTEGNSSLYRVCTESRKVILRLLPLFLPSATVGREIRFRQGDLVVVKDPEGLAADLKRVIRIGLETPDCLSHIHTLAVFGDLHGLGRWSFQFDMIRLRTFLPYCKNLRTLCLLFRNGGGHLCEQDSLADYTANLSVTDYISKLPSVQRTLREKRFTKLISRSQELQRNYVSQLRLYGEESKEAAHLSSLEVKIMVYSPPKPDPRLWPGRPELRGGCLTSNLQSLRDLKPPK